MRTTVVSDEVVSLRTATLCHLSVLHLSGDRPGRPPSDGLQRAWLHGMEPVCGSLRSVACTCSEHKPRKSDRRAAKSPFETDCFRVFPHRQAELRNKFSETKSSSSSGVNLYAARPHSAFRKQMKTAWAEHLTNPALGRISAADAGRMRQQNMLFSFGQRHIQVKNLEPDVDDDSLKLGRLS